MLDNPKPCMVNVKEFKDVKIHPGLCSLSSIRIIYKIKKNQDKGYFLKN